MNQPNPLRVALVGYGKMGRAIERLAPEFNGEIRLKLDEFNNQERAGLTPENFRDVDVAIDFSIPSAVVDNAVRLCELGVSVVIGTTGWLDRLEQVRRAVEDSGVGLVYGANFSVGVNAFYEIVGAASQLLAEAEDYDAGAYEAHHKFKKDAPSGTMLRLLAAMRQAGYERPIDVAHSRVGHVPGIHQIVFDSEADTIELRHVARGRDGFARGALRAARWIAGRRGFFEFSDIWRRTL